MLECEEVNIYLGWHTANQRVISSCYIYPLYAARHAYQTVEIPTKPSDSYHLETGWTRDNLDVYTNSYAK